MIKKSIVLLLIFCLTSFAAMAIPQNVGNHIVDVAVRSTWTTLIPKAKVSCYLGDHHINVRVSATGYVSQEFTILVEEPSGYFQRDVFLKDIPKELQGVDQNGKSIKAVYFVKDQYGFEPNEYGVLAFIPVEMWKRPNSKGVDLIDPEWGFSLKKTCVIEKVDEYYKVRMTMTRRALALTSPRLWVVFDTRDSVSNQRVAELASQLTMLEKKAEMLPPGACQSLAEYIIDHASPKQIEGLGESCPAVLKAYYAQSKKFSELHRESGEF